MKVVVGFSGGVDSAVTSMLLKNAGHEVIGVYLDNAGQDARQDAINGAERVEIPLHILDVGQELEEKVCRPFTDAYLRGQTPNPCILCNPSMKFRNLVEQADLLGAEAIATGHYARTEHRKLYKGNPANDQSYMLCRLQRYQLDRLILPLGAYPKSEVRAMAERFGLPVAHKPDSMEICFIPDKDYIGWISRRTRLPGNGKILLHDELIGIHEGIHRFTVGQRYPGLYHEKKVYIAAIDAETDTIQLAYWDELFKTRVYANDFNYLVDYDGQPFRASVRVRHTKWENPACTVYPDGDKVTIVCDEPVRAPAPGQSAVLYDGDLVIGGGFITGSEP